MTVNSYLAVTDLLAVWEADDLMSEADDLVISSSLDIISPSGIHAETGGG